MFQFTRCTPTKSDSTLLHSPACSSTSPSIWLQVPFSSNNPAHTPRSSLLPISHYVLHSKHVPPPLHSSIPISSLHCIFVTLLLNDQPVLSYNPGMRSDIPHPSYSSPKPNSPLWLTFALVFHWIWILLILRSSCMLLESSVIFCSGTAGITVWNYRQWMSLLHPW